jgi:hypothetical protein
MPCCILAFVASRDAFGAPASDRPDDNDGRSHRQAAATDDVAPVDAAVGIVEPDPVEHARREKDQDRQQKRQDRQPLACPTPIHPRRQRSISPGHRSDKPLRLQSITVRRRATRCVATSTRKRRLARLASTPAGGKHRKGHRQGSFTRQRRRGSSLAVESLIVIQHDGHFAQAAGEWKRRVVV